MNNIKIICDFRENYPSYCEQHHYNDHQDKDTFVRIKNAICNLGYNCEIFGGVQELLFAINRNESFPNTIFLNLSDGMSQNYSRVQVPVLCDILGVKYSGSGPFEVALTTNKYYSQLAVENIGINVPKAILITKNDILDIAKIVDINFPIIVKPNSAGSSIGITPKNYCSNKDEVKQIVRKLLNDFDELIVEQYIPGYDVTNFIIGNSPEFYLNEVLVAQHHNKVFFDTEAISYEDYARNQTSHVMASKYLDKILIERIKQATKDIIEELKVNDIARIDYRVTDKGSIYFLEINTVPAIHMNSQVGAICHGIEISFEEFLKRYIETVLKRMDNI